MPTPNTEYARAQILRAFGVTEDDLAALEAATGWNAAREVADRERETFVAELRRRAASMSEELSGKFGYEVRWGDGEA